MLLLARHGLLLLSPAAAAERQGGSGSGSEQRRGFDPIGRAIAEVVWE